MLIINIPKQELYDDDNDEFITVDAVRVKLEHSLVSLSKWESIYEKPFLTKDDKTKEEIHGYIKAMVISPEATDDLLERFAPEDFLEIQRYIDAKMTATWFSERRAPPSRETITSELIYYWMISFRIPMECENWHLNRLLTLIKVCNAKNEPPKKRSKADILARNRELNAQRKAQLNTKG